MLSDQVQLKAGGEVFAKNCGSCHGSKGEGSIGPNLTDKFWIHGAKLSEIYTTVEKGVLDKGMPPWGPVLKPEELKQVVAFVKSLKGSNPPNPKAPQGNEIND
jgi:cytochrome c oxidase cbb3-type subunit 3